MTAGPSPSRRSRSRRREVVALALTLIAACAGGCSADEDKGVPTPTGAGSKKSAKPAPSRADIPTRSTAPSVLQRRDLPPAGVERQVSFGAAGDSICYDRPKPEIIFDRRGFPAPAEGLDGGFPPLSEYDEPEIGDRFWICPAGFDPGQPVDVDVTDPTGTTQRKSLDADPNTSNLFLWRWSPRPGDPLGRYTVIVTQGSLRLTRSFRLHAASAPNSRCSSARRSALLSQARTSPSCSSGFVPR